MTPCLRPDEFIDVLDGAADPAATAHLVACAVCQATLAEVRDALAEAERATVPEPSPLFWPQVNARVRAAIADDPHASAGWLAWLRWDVVVPLAGLATIVVALAAAVGRVGTATPAAPIGAVAGLGAGDRTAADAAGDGALELVLDLAATVPDGEWDTLGVARLPDLGVAAEVLSLDEQQALNALLRAAVERPQS